MTPAITAPARGGFSAFTIAAPIMAALREEDGFIQIGAAFVAVIEAETGVKLSLNQAHFEPQIFEALSLIFQAQFSPPAPPEKKGKEKENLSLSEPKNDSERKGKGSQFSGPNFEEWESHCLAIGWVEKAEYTASYNSQDKRLGWASVKSWKGLAGCFHRNAIAKAAKAEKLAGAFGGKK